MEFSFNVQQLFKCGKDLIGIVDGNNIPKNSIQNISTVLDSIGDLSGKAQGLKATITTGNKFIGTDQRIYIKCEGYQVVGFLKVGVRKLFIRDELGIIDEISPLCVLDFYVFENQQRSGHGKQLFVKMLECEDIEPRKLAYDRPSEKLLSFLAKHYNLKNYVAQNNNYVVYKNYYNDTKSVKNKNKNNFIKNEEDDYKISDKITNGKIINNIENIKKSRIDNNLIFSESKKKPNSKYDDLNYDEMTENFNRIDLNTDKKITNKKKDDYNSNYNNNYNINLNSNLKKSTPWATNITTNNTYLSSSSSYGAYFTNTKNK